MARTPPSQGENRGPIPLRATNIMPTPIILKDKYLVFSFAAVAIILLISASMTYLNFAGNRNLLVIHFDSYKGIDFFGDNQDVLDIIVTGFIIFLINMALAKAFYFRERFLSYALATATVILAVLILIAVNGIISIN